MTASVPALSYETVQILKEAGEYLDKNYAFSPRMIDTAKRYGLSMFHFSRSFKQYYGISFKQALLHRKVEQAKKYLKSGMSQQDIVLKLRFATQSHFCATFKRLASIPPGQFRDGH